MPLQANSMNPKRIHPKNSFAEFAVYFVETCILKP